MHDIQRHPQRIRAGCRSFYRRSRIGISFGVLAQPVMGSVAPIVMSLVVFSGAAQFAALTVLTAGGGAVAAIAAGHADERPLAADGARGRAVPARAPAAPRGGVAGAGRRVVRALQPRRRDAMTAGS